MSALLSVRAAAIEAPSRDAIVLASDGSSLTYAQLASRVSSVGSALIARGVADGALVALTAHARLDVVLLLLALFERGAPFLPLHPRWTNAEKISVAADAGAIVWDESVVAALAAFDSKGAIAPALAIEPSAPLAVLSTSGTTGHPKGVVLARSAFVASALASAENLGFREDDRWLLFMPLAHAGGLSILTRCLIARRTVVLCDRFEADEALAIIERCGVTMISVVPTMLRALVDRDTRGVLSRLRVVLVGGAAASASLLEECAARGIVARTTYGLTEACSQVATQALRATGAVRLDVGLPLSCAEVRIADADGMAAAIGAEGRVMVRGPMMMTGYLGHPPLAKGEWFDTGDLGAIDGDGALRIFARHNDLIITGGENVSPVEVEQAIEAFDGVREALVFGVDDPVWGQRVAAAIVVAEKGESAPIDEPALGLCLAARLAPHKRPRLFCFVDELPKLASGKLDRAAASRVLAASLRPAALGPHAKIAW